MTSKQRARSAEISRLNQVEGEALVAEMLRHPDEHILGMQLDWLLYSILGYTERVGMTVVGDMTADEREEIAETLRPASISHPPKTKQGQLELVVRALKRGGWQKRAEIVDYTNLDGHLISGSFLRKLQATNRVEARRNGELMEYRLAGA